jgi:hypothetical protein
MGFRRFINGTTVMLEPDYHPVTGFGEQPRSVVAARQVAHIRE